MAPAPSACDDRGVEGNYLRQATMGGLTTFAWLGLGSDSFEYDATRLRR